MLLSNAASAQVYLGPKVGVTMSTLFLQENRNDVFNPKIVDQTKLGFTGGAVVQFYAKPHVGIQAEVNFIQKGWTELLDTVNTFSTTLNYLELPIMTHMYVGKKKTRWFVKVGPSIGLLLGYKESDFDSELEDQITYRMTDENRKNFMVGIQGGGGINRLTPVGRFQVDFTYGLSFSNIFRGSSSEMVPDRSLPSFVAFTLTWFKKMKD